MTTKKPKTTPKASVSDPDMTLRDWFAGQALKGLLEHLYSHGSADGLSQAAIDAYTAADQMMIARDAEPETEEPPIRAAA